MKVLFTMQAINTGKHELMPLGYPFTTYEVEDNYPEEDLISQGYSVKSLEEFETYKATFDLTNYLAAIGLGEDDLIKERLKKIEDICDDSILKLKTDMIKKGIASPYNGMVMMYLHDLMHLLEVQAMDESYEEIDRLIASGVPDNLSPYLTSEILTNFKNTLINRLATW